MTTVGVGSEETALAVVSVRGRRGERECGVCGVVVVAVIRHYGGGSLRCLTRWWRRRLRAGRRRRGLQGRILESADVIWKKGNVRSSDEWQSGLVRCGYSVPHLSLKGWLH